jgi:hypothetical protein
MRNTGDPSGLQDATLEPNHIMCRLAVSAVLSLVGALSGFEGRASAQVADFPARDSQQAPQTRPIGSPSSLNVVVLAGKQAANVLNPPSAVPPVIELRDASNRPVIGAVITFSAPADEPTVKFPNGNRTYSLVTDTSGRVAVENMLPLGAGKFSIDITANYDDSFGSASIQETNYPTLKSATAAGMANEANRVRSPVDHGLSKGAKIGIVAAVVAAGGIGIFFAAHAHSASSTVSVGTPTVGAPH